MRRAWQFVNGSLTAQIMGTLIATALLAVGASVWQAHTGQPVRWLRSVPVNVWWAIGGGVVVGVFGVLIAIIRRVGANRRHQRADSVIAVTRHPLFGWREFDVDYAEMSWRLVVPRPPSWHRTGALGFNATDARVDGRPRCPKCGTGLEERRTAFGRYRVKCVGCDFEVGQRDSFAVLAPRAERIGQRQLEVAEERQRQSPD